MVIGAIAAISVALILAYPEGGVVISIAIAPLLGLAPAPSRTLAFTVLLTAISYIIKVIRGKRVFRFQITELTVYGFILTVFLGGFAPGVSNTFEHAILCCSLMLIFPLAVNLMRYKRWIKICGVAFIAPSAVVAFVGIAQYCLGLAPYGWIDEVLFGGITSRAVSVFNNPNILGVYMAMMLPFALRLTLPKKNAKLRILGGIASVFIIVCTVFTFSRSAWIALAAGGLLFAVMISPKGFLWILPAAGVTALAALIFPDSVGARLINFITLSDSANSYRLSVWNSSWDMLSQIFAGGIGMGEEAFKTAYINFASAGTQYAMHSHSLYMQIAIQLGLVGLVLFFILLFSVSKKCFSSITLHLSDKELTSSVKAALSGAAALLIAGVFDYTWYNYRVFFIFWALLGFACAASNLNDAIGDEITEMTNDDCSSYISVAITKNGISSNDDYVKEIEQHDRRD